MANKGYCHKCGIHVITHETGLCCTCFIDAGFPPNIEHKHCIEAWYFKKWSRRFRSASR